MTNSKKTKIERLDQLTINKILEHGKKWMEDMGLPADYYAYLCTVIYTVPPCEIQRLTEHEEKMAKKLNELQKEEVEEV